GIGGVGQARIAGGQDPDRPVRLGEARLPVADAERQRGGLAFLAGDRDRHRQRRQRLLGGVADPERDQRGLAEALLGRQAGVGPPHLVGAGGLLRARGLFPAAGAEQRRQGHGGNPGRGGS